MIRGRRAVWDGFGVVTIATTSNVSAAQRGFVERMDEELPFDLTITSGTRPPSRQASAVSYKRVKEGDAAVRSLYSQKDLIDEVLAKGKTDVAGMTAVLTAQVKRGRYLSRHMRADAVDLRTRDKTASQIKQMQASAIRLGAKALVESDHLHLERVTSNAGKVNAALQAAGSAGGYTAQIAYAFKRIPWWGWVAGGTAVAMIMIGAGRRRRIGLSAAQTELSP
jgi:hypothetical protein